MDLQRDERRCGADGARVSRAGAVALVLALGLAGCAGAPTSPPPPSERPAADPAARGTTVPEEAAAAPAMTWTITPKDGGTQLAHGVPNSGVLDFALHCEPGARTLRVSVALAQDWPGLRSTEDGWVDASGRPGPWSTRAIVQSGELTHPAPARVEVHEGDGGVWVDADVPLTEALWDTFRRTGHIRATVAGEAVEPGALAPQLAASFLRRCAGG